MKYDFKNIVDINRAKEYFKHLIEKGAKIELKERREQRTYLQNRYLHLILSFVALELGYSLEVMKQHFFKRVVNPDTFEILESGKMGGVDSVRSSADLTTKEMTTAIDRFRDWCSIEVNIYVPKPDEKGFLEQIENEIERQKRWL